MRATLIIAALVLLPVVPAGALDLPTRKAGLWEINLSFEGRQMPAQVAKHCIDANTDKLMNAMGGQTTQEACSKQDLQHVGDSFVMDSVCKFGEATNVSHAVITGDFNSAYTVRVESRREGGRPMPGTAPGATTRMNIAAKWLGACQAGQKPGDVIMANGMKLNVLDMPRPGAPPVPPKR